MATHHKIIGTFTVAGFPQFDIGQVIAKVDTGAYTGALHCTKIHLEQTAQGEVLRFSPFDSPDTVVTTKEFKIKNVKSSNGSRQSRYFVNTIIEVEGEQYPILLSLADRSDMKWELLIGRKFLRDNHFLVDAAKTSPLMLAKQEMN